MALPRAQTVGEAVEALGYCQVMLDLAELAIVLGRTPVGEWDRTFVSDRRWRICLNGGPHAQWTVEAGIVVPRFHAFVLFNGWPVAMVDAAGGPVVGNQEQTILDAIAKERQAISTA